MNTFSPDTIHPGDCRDILPTLPDHSVDLVFADPPYNLQLRGDLYRPNHSKVDAVDDAWDKFDSFEAYDAFTRAWLTECRRILKPDSSLWVIGTYHNIYRVGAILLDLGYWIINEIAWVKTNPMPNFRGVRFTNAHETLIWAKPSESARYTFNYQHMKAVNGGKQMRSDWHIPICTGDERIKIDGKKAHATQKPEALLERVILASTRAGDVILDPFFGTGTTGAVAKRLGRQWIGIERDAKYIDIARRRIAHVTPEPQTVTPEKRGVQRIPFKALIDCGLIGVGEVLTYAGDEDIIAVVQPDGSLVCRSRRGSIHQIAKHLAGGAVNGWTAWCVTRAGGVREPIDALRQKLREG